MDGADKLLGAHAGGASSLTNLKGQIGNHGSPRRSDIVKDAISKNTATNLFLLGLLLTDCMSNSNEAAGDLEQMLDDCVGQLRH
jgi:hypothetical protein